MNVNMELKNTFLKSAVVVALIASGSVFAAGAKSGQLVIVNALGNVDASGYVGSSASSVNIVVSDSTGPCSTTANVAYNGVVTVKWNSASTHSSTVCTDITSVAVTPIKATIGSVTTIIYDSVSTTTVPATTATAAISYTPPTTAYGNLALIVSGTGSPAGAVTASATVWGVGAASAPVFDTGNGSLTTMGVPGGLGAYGVKAESIMRQYAITPYKGN